jgi:hypothetical protein
MRISILVWETDKGWRSTLQTLKSVKREYRTTWQHAGHIAVKELEDHIFQSREQAFSSAKAARTTLKRTQTQKNTK